MGKTTKNAHQTCRSITVSGTCAKSVKFLVLISMYCNSTSPEGLVEFQDFEVDWQLAVPSQD